MIGSGFHRCHARPLRRFLGDADGVGAVSHLGPNVTGPNPKFVPEDDKVIEKIGTFQNRGVGASPHGLKGDFSASSTTFCDIFRKPPLMSRAVRGLVAEDIRGRAQ
jgi:hypothetical protein